jgi:Xaa-Pro aminopeptidase
MTATREAIREERRRRLLDAMTEAKLDALVVAGNAWRSDYLAFATDAAALEGTVVALVHGDGRTELIAESPAEAERIAAECAAAADWAPDPVAEAEHRLRRLGNRRIALAPAQTLPVGLKREGRDDATALLDRLMRIKSTAELDAIRRAARLADDGYQVFLQAARVGRPEYELIAEVEGYFRSRGCPDNFMIMGSGGPEVRGMRPPNDRRLQRGDMVTTELTPCMNGYYAQICRTLVVGEPSAEQRAAFAIWLEALEAGIAAVRPGATAGDVARAENDVFRRHGLGDYVTSEYTRVRGHGVGLWPDAPPAVLEDVDMVLEPDMTLIVHPNTYNPVVGYLVLGDVVRVTETGCESLCGTPRELFSVPG